MARWRWILGLSAAAGVVLVALWWFKGPDEAVFDDRISRFPYPNIQFLRNKNVWLELGITQAQAEFLLDRSKLKRTFQEVGRFGSQENDLVDEIIKLERTEAQFNSSQKKRYFELCLQYADTLALRDPDILRQLALTELQRQQVEAAQFSFDEARRVSRKVNESTRVEANSIYRKNGEVGRLALEIADPPYMPGWIDHSEKIYVRSLLTKIQLARLEVLKGRIASVETYEPFHVQSNSRPEFLLKILQDSDFQKEYGIKPKLLEGSIAEGEQYWTSTGYKTWEPILTLIKIWPELTDAQLSGLQKESIRRGYSLDLALRGDIAKLLGMSDEERDRLSLRKRLYSWSNGREHIAMRARQTKLAPGDYGYPAGEIVLSSSNEPRFDTVQDHDIVLWAGMSTPVRKKWLELGGKEPKVRPLED